MKNCLLTRYYLVKDLCIQPLVRKLLLWVLYSMVSQPVDINTNTYWFNCPAGLLLNTLFMMTLDVLYWAFFMFDYYNSVIKISRDCWPFGSERLLAECLGMCIIWDIWNEIVVLFSFGLKYSPPTSVETFRLKYSRWSNRPFDWLGKPSAV